MSTLDMVVIFHPDQVTPDWLTEVLRGAGVLRRGHVKNLRHELVLKYNSSIYRLHVGYGDELVVGRHQYQTDLQAA